jgi:hypothetical protein
MGLLGWFTKRGESEQDRRLRHWRDAWDAAARTADATAIVRLRSELDALALPEEEIEIEREMLDGLEQLAALSTAVDSGGLPTIQTGHRVVGADACHFTAPASMPDEPSQPGGRLLLTSARLIFVGGPGATAAWHALAEVVQADRDVVLIRADRGRIYRFRCNSYTDALTGAFLARRLIAARRR